jgi:dynein regulatry complex protein 1
MQEEFNTNHPDKEERKKARRKRIEKRHEEQSRDLGESDGKPAGVNRTGAQQVSDSMLHLDRRKHTGLEHVTGLRVKSDTIESKRRAEEDDTRKDRLGKLQGEAFSSAKANAAIEMRWAELLEKEIPQELHEEMQHQMAACTEVIKSKDELIAEFQLQLRAKDEEYVRALRQQSEDVEGMLQRIRAEFAELQGEYEKELLAIEEAYTDERERIISERVSEIDSLFEHRKAKEIFYKESKQKREEQYQRDMDDLITKGASQYNKLKIELEINIQTLKQQLEEIRATYQLNTEKLDYNYRVLTELDVEKNAELARYKKRIAKLKDQLSTLVSKYTEAHNADQKTNSELTEDYRNLTRKYKDLQAKFRHFEVSDTNKYDEVWTMHEDEAKDLVDQLLKADKIIVEYQMGWKWKAPDMHALQHVLGKYGSLGQKSGDAEKSAVEEEAAADAVIEKKESVSGAKIRGMLKLLAREAGFLINPDVQKSLESLPEDDAKLESAETLLKVLGVKSEEKLASLVKYFFTDNKTAQLLQQGDVDAVEEAEAELKLHNDNEDVAELRDMISPEDVMSAVRTYIEDVSAEAPAMSAPAGGKDDDRVGQKRLNSMRNFWIQLSNVVNDDSVDVWKQMEGNYLSLKDLLRKRAASIADVDDLNARNADLKQLLNQYLGDQNINRGLQVPPAQVMRVKDQPKSKTGKMTKKAPGVKVLASKTQ